MFHKLSNALFLLPHTIRSLSSYKKLSEAKLEGIDLSPLTTKQIERVRYYIFLNYLIIDAFATLHGKRLKETEKSLGALIGAFTPIYDDLMDELSYTHEQIVNKEIGAGPLEKVYLLMIQRIKERHHDFNSFEQYFNLAGKAQNESIGIQKESTTSIDKLRDIMNTKGGYFCLLFRTAITEEISKGEEQACYKLGGLTQYVNDIFDIWKDHLDGLFTLPIKIQSKDDLRKDYVETLQDFFVAYRSLNLKQKDTTHFFLKVYLLLSRGLVAIDQYQSVEDKKTFDISQLSRKELVCDMERPANLLKNFQYTFRLDSF